VSRDVVIDKIWGEIDLPLTSRHPNFTVAKAERAIRIREIYGVFSTEVAVVPAAILVHRMLAQN